MRHGTGGAAAQRLAAAARGGKPDRHEHPSDVVARNSALVCRYFIDLRSALRLTPQAAAYHLQTSPETIAALESARFDLLPRWPDVVRVVTAYSAMAQVDGAPALAMIADTIVALSEQQADAQLTAPAEPKRRSRPNMAGAFRLSHDALRGARARPDRAFYALGLPLALLLLALNTSAMTAALTSVSDYFRVHFAEVREGLRWIDVSDPRSRRGDLLANVKLQGPKR